MIIFIFAFKNYFNIEYSLILCPFCRLCQEAFILLNVALFEICDYLVCFLGIVDKKG